MSLTTTADHERLTVREVARGLRCGEATARRRIKSGQLPACQLGGPGTGLRIRSDELEAWLTHERPSYLKPEEKR
jgi:excisionase family DNA binding protein